MVNQTSTWWAILIVANNNLKCCREDSPETNQENWQVSNAGRLGKMLVVVMESKLSLGRLDIKKVAKGAASCRIGLYMIFFSPH